MRLRLIGPTQATTFMAGRTGDSASGANNRGLVEKPLLIV